MNYYIATGLINALTSSVLGIFVFMKDKKAKVNQTFAFFCATVAFWSWWYFAWQLSDNFADALRHMRLAKFGSILIAIAYVHFIAVFLGKFLEKRKIIVFGYAAFIFFWLSNFTPLFIRTMEPELSFKFWPKPGVLFYPFLALWLGYVAYGIHMLFKSYRKSYGIKKNQIKYLLIGTAIGFAGGITNYILWFDIPIPPFGNGLVPVYVVLATYAIVRYRLMDITLAIGRVITFLLSFFTILVSGFLMVFIYSKLWISVDPFQLSFLILLFSVGVFYLHRFYERLAEIYFYPAFYRKRIILSDLERDLSSLIEIEPFSELVAGTLKKAFALEKIAVFVRVVGTNGFKLQKNLGFEEGEITEFAADKSFVEPLERIKKPFGVQEILNLSRNPGLNGAMEGMKNRIEELRIEILVPLLFEGRIMGIIALGEKPKREAYSKEDMQLLAGLSKQASIALRNTLLYSEVKNRKDELERFYRLTVDKEMENLKLKKRVKELEKKS